MRIGHGYDVHALVKDRKLILCGVDIPFPLGLEGHSDADVALHAVMDAVLGALALGDIGAHFPDQDNQYLNIDSRLLLRRVVALMTGQGYRLGNLDCTIIAQRPKLAPYIPAMRSRLAEDFCCDLSKISVKATTEEHMGFTGEGRGISAHAVVLLEEEMHGLSE